MPTRHKALKAIFGQLPHYKKEKMQIRCLTDTHVIDVKPPLTIIHVGSGCKAYSSNLFIPAKSELTSKDNAVVRHIYFQHFNEDYQNITRYSLIEDLGLIKKTYLIT